jgi:hypothetical protein
MSALFSRLAEPPDAIVTHFLTEHAPAIRRTRRAAA